MHARETKLLGKAKQTKWTNVSFTMWHKITQTLLLISSINTQEMNTITICIYWYLYSPQYLFIKNTTNILTTKYLSIVLTISFANIPNMRWDMFSTGMRRWYVEIVDTVHSFTICSLHDATIWQWIFHISVHDDGSLPFFFLHSSNKQSGAAYCCCLKGMAFKEFNWTILETMCSCVFFAPTINYAQKS